MKRSKIFFLVLATLVLVFAFSACRGSEGDVFAGKTFPATVSAIDGNTLQLSVIYSSGIVASPQYNATLGSLSSLATVKPNGDFQLSTLPAQGSGQAFATFTAIKNTVNIKALTVTVSEDMANALSVGDSVYVTFDENARVTKIEMRENPENADKK